MSSSEAATTPQGTSAKRPTADDALLAEVRDRLLRFAVVVGLVISLLKTARLDAIGAASSFAVTSALMAYLVVAPRRPTQRLDARGMLALLTLLAVGFAGVSQGVFSLALVYLVFLPVLAVVFVDEDTALFQSSVAAVVVALFALADAVGWVFPQPLYMYGSGAIVGAHLLAVLTGNTVLARALHHWREVALDAERTTARELRAMNHRLEEARQEADLANQTKSAFIASISHEIRTPMNAVLGLSETAAREAPSHLRDDLQLMHSAAGSLLRMLDDLLDLSKLEAGAMTLENNSVDLVDCGEKAAELFAEQARHKGVLLITDFRTGGTVRGDATRIRQILLNLLGNALKFTEEGEVRLRVRRTPSGLLRFEVSDTGPGIEPKVQARIFEAFRQAERSTSRLHGGTGLGLAICRALAEAMGGSIGVQSTVGQGSTFHVDLPLVPEHPPDTPLEGVRAHVRLPSEHPLFDSLCSALTLLGAELAQDGRGTDTVLVDADDHGVTLSLGGAAVQVDTPVRPSAVAGAVAELRGDTRDETAPALAQVDLEGDVLVVEDNAVNRVVATRMLQTLGCSFDVVESGERALERLTSGHDYAVVLMDCQMPGLDGYDTTRRLRSWEQRTRTARTPVLALTAHAGADARTLAARAGMDDHLSKPLTLHHLAEALTRWSGKRAD